MKVSQSQTLPRPPGAHTFKMPHLSIVVNSTVEHIGSVWHPDPTSRGTWGIVLTCFSTLVICVWSCLHVDIPIRYQDWSIWEKLRWLLVGLFAPDVLIFKAYAQKYWAWRLSRCAKVYLPAKKDASSRLQRCWRSIRKWARSTSRAHDVSLMLCLRSVPCRQIHSRALAVQLAAMSRLMTTIPQMRRLVLTRYVIVNPDPPGVTDR